MLGPLEHDVMEVMWSVKSAPVRDIFERLLQRRPIAYTTVLTVMNNLKAKGLLSRYKSGKAHVYAAVLSRDAFIEKECTRAVSEVLERFGDLAVAKFVEQSAGMAPSYRKKIGEIADRLVRSRPGSASNLES